jgi:5-formyltetrahydrofolate cyclo-ligase
MPFSMEDQLQAAKAALREQVRNRLPAISATTRVAASCEFCARLRQQKVWLSAKSFLFFAPLRSEPDIWPLLEEALAAGKTVTLPRFSAVTQTYAAARVLDLPTDLCRGNLGIREPKPHCETFALNRLDLVLVPGVAFDLHGRRLGRGKGYYDRLLVDVRGTKCGVAFDEQIVPEVPVGPQDVPLNCILTPTRWLVC